jgi:hypothetical protein
MSASTIVMTIGPIYFTNRLCDDIFQKTNFEAWCDLIFFFSSLQLNDLVLPLVALVLAPTSRVEVRVEDILINVGGVCVLAVH